jgi:hypothetical protein
VITQLLLAVLASMPIIGARVFYAVAVYAGNITSAQTSFPLKLVFGDITEFIVAIILITAGIMTRHLNRKLKADYEVARVELQTK